MSDMFEKFVAFASVVMAIVAFWDGVLIGVWLGILMFWVSLLFLTNYKLSERRVKHVSLSDRQV